MTLNDAEREEYNELLVKAQELTGVVFTSVKDSYKQMLDQLISRSIQIESTVHSDAPKTDAPESTVHSDESTVNSPEFENALFERTKVLADECTVLSEAKEKAEHECTVKSQRIQELEAALQNAFLEQEVVEIEVEKPLAPGPNDVYLQLEENHAMVLRTIAKNRATRLKMEIPITISQVVHEMIFNKGVLYNWHGEYWTGLK